MGYIPLYPRCSSCILCSSERPCRGSEEAAATTTSDDGLLQSTRRGCPSVVAAGHAVQAAVPGCPSPPAARSPVIRHPSKARQNKGRGGGGHAKRFEFTQEQQARNNTAAFAPRATPGFTTRARAMHILLYRSKYVTPKTWYRTRQDAERTLQHQLAQHP